MTRRAIFLLALLLACGAAQAQIYRWVDKNGKVQYSNVKPPEGVAATVVDPDAKAGPAAPDSTECHTIRCQGERMEERQRRRDADEARASAERAAAPKQPRGLDFRNYIRIYRGMTEGELLGIAGEPDFRSEEGIAYGAPATVQSGRNLSTGARVGMSVRTYTYMPTTVDPFTTVITLVGGRVSEIERIRRF